MNELSNSEMKLTGGGRMRARRSYGVRATSLSRPLQLISVLGSTRTL